MRGTKAKYNRRVASYSPQRVSIIPLVSDSYKGGVGKSMVSGMAAKFLTTPRGTWKGFWTQKIQNISYQNRLPRGFKEPTLLLTDLHWDYP